MFPMPPVLRRLPMPSVVLLWLHVGVNEVGRSILILRVAFINEDGRFALI